MMIHIAALKRYNLHDGEVLDLKVDVDRNIVSVAVRTAESESGDREDVWFHFLDVHSLICEPPLRPAEVVRMGSEILRFDAIPRSDGNAEIILVLLAQKTSSLGGDPTIVLRFTASNVETLAGG